jgi:hypothetical protein
MVPHPISRPRPEHLELPREKSCIELFPCGRRQGVEGAEEVGALRCGLVREPEPGEGREAEGPELQSSEMIDECRVSK